MYKELGYAKHDSDVIWQIVCDNEDGTVDISIDDIQGDIAVIGVKKCELILVEKKDYDKRISELTAEYNAI